MSSVQASPVDEEVADRVRLCWSCPLDVHLIDGTYELFRHYYALPSARDRDGHEVAAVRGVLASVLGMIRGGATHIAVATDHVIESFRNGLWPGYKTGEGIEPDLLAQFNLLEETLVPWHTRSPASASARCCFGRSPLSGPALRSLGTWTNYDGTAPSLASTRWERDSTQPPPVPDGASAAGPRSAPAIQALWLPDFVGAPAT